MESRRTRIIMTSKLCQRRRSQLKCILDELSLIKTLLITTDVSMADSEPPLEVNEEVDESVYCEFPWRSNENENEIDT